MNTPPTLENNGETKELFNHNIICPNNKILKQYKFIRTGENPNKFYYHYECVDNLNKHNNFIDKQTNLNDYGNGQSIYLDRHSLECPPTHALSKIQLTGQVINDPKQIQYNYRCTDANIKNLSDHDTRYNDDGNMSVIYFDRHDVKCPNNSVLNSVKLRRKFPRSGPSDEQFRFEYKCGHTDFIPDPNNYYQNSNQIDKDKSGNPTSHVKAHIQSLILYYGLFKKNIDLNIVTSHGGELASNLTPRIQEHVKSTGSQYVWRVTQSDSWCPLIWKALQLSGKRIKDEWTRFVPAQNLIDDLAQQFSQMLGWIDYADYILTSYQDPGFENSFDNQKLQNESKKIKLQLRLQSAQNIDDKQNGYINAEIQNIIKYYANGNNIHDLAIFNLNKNTKDIFDEAAIFNGPEQSQSYDIIFVPLIWKALQLSGYFVPNDWIIYRKKHSQADQDIFNNFAERLSRINGFVEFALFCILDYMDISKYNARALEWKYILHQNDIIDILNNYDVNTELTTREQIELLYKTRVHSMYGGYKQKYLKYKQKYNMLKLQLKN
jgi:hypothetical protein